MNNIDDFARLRVAFRLQLGIDQLPVHTDLEPASVRGNECHRFDHVLEILEQIIRQAHGSTSVMSDRTVNNLDLKHEVLRIM